jgi:hypothetical protein
MFHARIFLFDSFQRQPPKAYFFNIQDSGKRSLFVMQSCTARDEQVGEAEWPNWEAYDEASSTALPGLS